MELDPRSFAASHWKAIYIIKCVSTSYYLSLFKKKKKMLCVCVLSFGLHFTYMFQKKTLSQSQPAVSSVAKRTLSVREVWGSIPGLVKSTQCRRRLATVATFLRSCVAQALSRGNGPRNSLHASA